MEIHATNVNDAYAAALRQLQFVDGHDVEPSRNGEVWVFPEPVITIYDRPEQRVLFSPLRDANPFFHFFEALHMLAGKNDLAFLEFFNSKMKNYSDDGKTLWGSAYGYRWRRGFGVDQLQAIAELLIREPSTRRAVLSMWAPQVDLAYACRTENKDAVCNTHAYLDVRGGELNLTVCCRSNDLWFGCYGANAVHFSFLQEFMAAYVGVPVGVYRQFSNNLHLYTAVVNPEKIDELILDAETHDEYLNSDIKHFPLVQSDAEQWLRELDRFMYDPMNEKHASYTEDFFPGVAIPMYRAWWLRKEGHTPHEVTLAAKDWDIACNSWLERHKKKVTV